MINWKEYRKKLFGRIGELGKLTPDTVAGYQTLSNAGKKTAHLDDKTRELISLAVAVTTRCDGCIAVHAEAALKTWSQSRRNCRSFRRCSCNECWSRDGLFSQSFRFN